MKLIVLDPRRSHFQAADAQAAEYAQPRLRLATGGTQAVGVERHVTLRCSR